MKGAADADCYLGEHNALQCDLLCMGVDYSNGEAIFNLLKGLPHFGTWPAFKLVLQTSVSGQSGGSSLLTSVSSGGSSVSAALSMGTMTFEFVSTCIATEAHKLVLESPAAPLGSEFANVAAITSPPGGGGGICGGSNHDHAHCYKPGGGMAGQQPWKQPGKGKNGSSASESVLSAGSGLAASAIAAGAPVPPTVPPFAAAAVTSGGYITCNYDLSCASLVELPSEGQPSDDILACLAAHNYTCLLNSGEDSQPWAFAHFWAW
ncbi:hypothetical protein J3A83DRAFT_4367322 [Scleroderma citrinum]